MDNFLTKSVKGLVGMNSQSTEQASGSDTSDLTSQEVINILANERGGISTPAVGQNVMIESVLDTVASELSQLSFNHIHLVEKEVENEDGEKEKKKDIEEVENSDIKYALTVRANELQTSSDMLYSFFYNVVSEGNGILLPIYDDKGNTIGFDTLDVSEYTFAKGYDNRDGHLYLLLVKKEEFEKHALEHARSLGIRDTDNLEVEVLALRYDSIIHQRWKPNMLFNSEVYGDTSLSNLTTIFDKNLGAMLGELNSNGEVSAVLKIKGALGSNEGKKARRDDLVRDIRSGSRIIVMDDSEDFKELNKKFNLMDKEHIEQLQEYIFDFYGVNKHVVAGNFTFEQYHAFYNKVLEPMITRFLQELNHKVIGRKAYMEGEKIVPLKRLLVGGGLTDVIEAVDKYVYHGIIDRNEMRQELGLSPRAGGDVLLSNANAVRRDDYGNRVDERKPPKEQNPDESKGVLK